MKTLLGIVVLGIFLLTCFVWPLKFQMLDYCSLEQMGMNDVYYEMNIEIRTIKKHILYINFVILTFIAHLLKHVGKKMYVSIQ